jgi:phosphatidate cytidylyltransferase
MLARVLSGIVLAGGIIAVLLLTPAWGLGLVVLAALLLVAGEFEAMAHADRRVTRFEQTVFRLSAVIAVSWPVLTEYIPAYDAGRALMLAFMVLSIGRLARPDPIEDSLKRLSADGFALLYMGVTFPYIFLLRQANDPHGGWVVLLVMAVIFGGDTGAYFSGRFLGKHKLYPKISPKKTIEGAIGGLAAGVGIAFLARAYFPGHDALTVVDCIILGAGGAAFGAIGDLVESMLKRAYKVKDSGALIPGHGGMLDRIDGLLFGGPLMLFYLQAVVSW